MMALIILVGIAGVCGNLAALMRGKTNTALKHHVQHTAHMVPHAFTMLFMVAHASEFTRVVSHVSLTHAVITAALFTLWVLTRPKSEPEE